MSVRDVRDKADKEHDSRLVLQVHFETVDYANLHSLRFDSERRDVILSPTGNPHQKRDMGHAKVGPLSPC